MARKQQFRRTARLGLVLSLSLTLGACSADYTNHGYMPPQDDVEQVVVGIDTRASVEETLGPAASDSIAGEGNLYYVRSRVRSFAMLEPKVIEREVLAISFDQGGVVRNVERFGLERGQVVPLSRRVTDTGIEDRTFLRQLLGNIGRIGPQRN